jgi:fucose 4-O-acetylase-like acetyltransferase
MMEPQGQTSHETRRPEIDFAKGVMITLMVFGHTTHVGSAAPTLLDVVGWIYTFHMPAFMVISGYFVTPGRGVRNELMRTVRRIVIPYLLFETVYLCALRAASQAGFPVSNELRSLDLAELLRRLVADPIGGYWYLHALSIYLLAYHTADALSGGQAVRRWAVLALLLLGVIASPIVFRLDTLMFFGLGTALRAAGARLPTGWSGAPLLLAMSLLFGATALRTTPELRTIWVFAVLAVVQQVAIDWRRFPIDLVAFVGRNTLGVLLLHAAVLNALKPMQPVFLAADPTGLLNSLSATFAGVVLPIGVVAVADRLHVSSILFGTEPAYRPLLYRKR